MTACQTTPYTIMPEFMDKLDIFWGLEFSKCGRSLYTVFWVRQYKTDFNLFFLKFKYKGMTSLVV